MHSKVKQQSGSSMFDRMVNQITNAAQSNSSSTTSEFKSAASEGAKGLKHLMKLGGVNIGKEEKRRESSDSAYNNSHSTGSARPSIDGSTITASSSSHTLNGSAGGQPQGLQITDKDGQLSLEVTERMLRWHAEAVGRMIELSPTSDASKNAVALLKVLGDTLGQAYLETALDT